jgi:tetratricopeptide (TPR) repeat protein
VKALALDSGAARAARLQALNNEAELRIVNGLAPVSAPGLLAVLTEMRKLGGTATADRMAASASSLLQRRAEAALDQGDVESGIELYRSALSLDPAAEGASLLARALLDRGRRALAARHPAEAVRWGRKALSYAEADPGAHAFLADAFFAAREYSAAAEEYAKALSSRPDDPALRRGLARSRAKLAAVRSKPTAGVAPAGGAAAGPGAAGAGAPAAVTDTQIATVPAGGGSPALTVSSVHASDVGARAGGAPAAHEPMPSPPPPTSPPTLAVPPRAPVPATTTTSAAGEPTTK